MRHTQRSRGRQRKTEVETQAREAGCMTLTELIVEAADQWLVARQEAIRILASGGPALVAVSALGAAEARLADTVRARQKERVDG